MKTQTLRFDLPRSVKRFLWIEALVLAGIWGGMVIMSLGPRLIGYSSFVVYSGSMEPGIQKGSVAIARPLNPASVDVGDVIVFRTQGASLPTLHRIIEIKDEAGARTVTTKGDANSAVDPAPITLTGRGSKVIYSVPYMGYLLHANQAPGDRHCRLGSVDDLAPFGKGAARYRGRSSLTGYSAELARLQPAGRP
jgi:signal peptidase I